MSSTSTEIRNGTSPDIVVADPVFPTPSPSKFPSVVVVIVLVWAILLCAYFISKWRQKPRESYIIPRVFVLCSPRNVQFHYEIILRVGLASSDFNPEKHDIDVTIFGHQKNEIVSLTRLNTNTLLDDPLITSLSLIVYRLVELPPIGSLLLKHSGPFKAWLHVYDVTLIDLATNREEYYIVNQFIGSLNRHVVIEKPNHGAPVKFPIDDVPLPHLNIEDVFLALITTINWITLSTNISPINCNFYIDIVCILIISLGGLGFVVFLEWLIRYQIRWNQERKDFFNQIEQCRLWPSDSVMRIGILVFAMVLGGFIVYFSFAITDYRDTIVWFLSVVNSCSLTLGLWNIARQADVGNSIVNLGLKCKGVHSVSVGMRYSDLVSTKNSNNGSTISTSNSASKIIRSFGPRSSVKSFGFNPMSKKTV